MIRYVTMKVNEDEKIFEFSDGFWMPMDYLLPSVDTAEYEWEKLYKKNWFTHDMFKTCVKAIERIYGVDMFNIIHLSGTWALELDDETLDFLFLIREKLKNNGK